MSYLPFTRPSIDDATIEGVAEVLRSGWLTSGPNMRAFEAALSEYFGRPVRSCASATAGLEIALKLAGVEAGEEVITTPMSWVATANSVLHMDAVPVFVDIDRATRNIDLDKVEAAITPRTKAIMPVDLAGLPVDRDRLYDIAKRNNLRVIEDAAQSMGANWKGRIVGSFGDLCSVSFHANKNITTGEGGALVLNNEDEAKAFELWRLQGVVRHPGGEQSCDISGFKANLTDIAARIGLGQLPRLKEFNARRTELAKRYFNLIPKDLGLELPIADFEQSNWHMFQPLLPLDRMKIDRKGFIEAMHAREIAVGVHYPAMHTFGVFKHLGHSAGDFPISQAVGQQTITLPLFPGMHDDDVDRVCEAVDAVLRPNLI
ncbi:DegT/DnrJ/EryC1/StrS aminotransferase family protein [Burkholderiaceae bacterium DAT-1]|nr:DegT/DnrJ/EryC1/StrS aminotransferase family protein [Burkholderiaceae bacterium DAT-1]